MRLASPLRYPGGKSMMASLLGQTLKINQLGRHSVCEPYAGGAGASLSLLIGEATTQVAINDADEAVFAFWWALLERTKQFLDEIDNVPVTIEEWKRQRDTYRSRRSSRFSRGFATFFLNRCNRSGIVINGGPIGGLDQRGKWAIDARFNRPNLRSRCARIASYRSRISISRVDGIEFIGASNVERPFYFVDPPYYGKGPTLYLNSLNDRYHKSLADRLRELDYPWLLTYDDCPQIRKLYKGWANIRPFSLRYAANERRMGREVLISPKGLELPANQSSTAVGW